ncbi:YcfL family protein [Pseudomonas sp. SDO558_S425]
MRHFILGALALVLLAGCATPLPPEPGSAASKIVVMGKFKGIAVGTIRVARENGFLTAKVQLSNITSSNQMMYYRFAWLGADGFPVGDEETWKVLNLYANQATFLPAIANLPQAADFRLEVKTP